jgi:osmoprotectant transport system substrate-binding protein
MQPARQDTRAAQRRRRGTQKAVRMRPRRLVLMLIPVLLAAACGGSSHKSTAGTSPSAGGSTGGGAAASGSLTIGTAGFTESNILGYMFADLLQKAGFSTKVTQVESTEIFESSLEKGQIDVVPEYVATYADFLNNEINGASAKSVSSPSLAQSLAALKTLATKKGLAVLTPTNAVDQNAFAVSKGYASQHHLTTLSDLGKSGLSVTIAAGPECVTRPFCAPGLEKTYGIKVKGVDKLGVDTIQAKKAVQDGKDQLVLVLTTDGTLADFNLVALTDDKHLQNADYLVPVVNAKSLAAHPQIETALDKLSSVLTTSDLAQLNKKVDVERQTAADVAKAYLTSKGLI